MNEQTNRFLNITPAEARAIAEALSLLHRKPKPIEPSTGKAPETLGQRLRFARKSCGISTKALGKAMGFSYQSIWRWEEDISLPNAGAFLALHKAMGISADYLLGIENSNSLVGIQHAQQSRNPESPDSHSH